MNITMKQAKEHLINNKDAIIRYKETKAKKAEKFTLSSTQMLSVINALLVGSETSFYYQDGITILKTISSYDERDLQVKRLSNRIIRIRDELPKGALLTFRYKTDSFDGWKYGVIKSPENIKALNNLRNRIISELEIKDNK